nr:beta-glucuronosyltransferase GlcAT14A [Ipomoea batatas]
MGKIILEVLFLSAGSSYSILSRKFLDFCILGTENFPRTLLMYLSNTPSSDAVYFPTVLCNSRQFNRTIINHNLQYVSLNSRKEARVLNSSDFLDMIRSGAAFASPFQERDPILDKIDSEILHRSPGKPVPGGWCLGNSETDRCAVWGDADVLRPGVGAKRLEKHFIELFADGRLQSQQCIEE